MHGKGQVALIYQKLQSSQMNTLKIQYFSSLANPTFDRAMLYLLIQDLADLSVLAINFYKQT